MPFGPCARGAAPYHGRFRHIQRNPCMPLFRRPHTVLAASLAALLVACTPTPPAGEDADARLLGRLFDAEHGRVIEDGEVVIADGRVRCAGPRDGCPVGADTPVHDHGDALILPGLIDLHVHVRPQFVGAFVPAGISTVRDANSTLAMLETLRADPQAPRMHVTGPMIDGPGSVLLDMPDATPGDDIPLPERMPLVADSPEAAAAAVQALAEAGVDWIKLYEQLPPAVFDAAVRAAQDAQLPVMADLGIALTRGLAGAEVDIVQAARAGVATNEHLSGLALAYQRRGGDVAADTLDDALLDAIVADIAATGMAVVPTAANTLQFAEPDPAAPDTVPGAAVLAPHFAGYWDHLVGMVAQVEGRTRTDRALLQATLPRLHAAGVPVGAGSDLPAGPYMLPGGALHQELVALVDIGLTPAQALQAATWQAARILRADDIGHLQPGARADLLVVDGDPLQRIEDTRQVRSVWFDAREVDLEAAWARVGEMLEAAAR